MDNEIKKIGEVIKEVFEVSQNDFDLKSDFAGISTGFESLNNILGGWQRGELITIAGRPSMGKTSFAISMIKNICLDTKTPLLFFTTSSTVKQITTKLIACENDIDSEHIFTGRLRNYEVILINESMNKINESPLYIVDSSTLTIENLYTKAQNAVKDYGVKIILIDYFQLIYDEVKFSENRYLELNYFSRRLNSLAKELNVPVIVFSQLGRDIDSREGRDNKTPVLSDLKGSGTLLDDSDVVCFIHRPECYNCYEDDKGNDLRGIAEFIIAKNRNADMRSILLQFDKSRSWFTDNSVSFV